MKKITAMHKESISYKIDHLIQLRRNKTEKIKDALKIPWQSCQANQKSTT